MGLHVILRANQLVTFLPSTLTPHSPRDQIIDSSGGQTKHRIWDSRNASQPETRCTSPSLYPSSIMLYGCETWTSQKRKDESKNSNPNKGLRRIFYKEHITNEYVRNAVAILVGPQETLLATFKQRKFAWFSHVARNDTVPKTVLQRYMEGGRCCGIQKKTEWRTSRSGQPAQ